MVQAEWYPCAFQSFEFSDEFVTQHSETHLHVVAPGTVSHTHYPGDLNVLVEGQEESMQWLCLGCVEESTLQTAYFCPDGGGELLVPHLIGEVVLGGEEGLLLCDLVDVLEDLDYLRHDYDLLNYLLEDERHLHYALFYRVHGVRRALVPVDDLQHLLDLVHCTHYFLYLVNVDYLLYGVVDLYQGCLLFTLHHYHILLHLYLLQFLYYYGDLNQFLHDVTDVLVHVNELRNHLLNLYYLRHLDQPLLDLLYLHETGKVDCLLHYLLYDLLSGDYLLDCGLQWYYLLNDCWNLLYDLMIVWDYLLYFPYLLFNHNALHHPLYLFDANHLLLPRDYLLKDLCDCFDLSLYLLEGHYLLNDQLYGLVHDAGHNSIAIDLNRDNVVNNLRNYSGDLQHLRHFLHHLHSPFHYHLGRPYLFLVYGYLYKLVNVSVNHPLHIYVHQSLTRQLNYLLLYHRKLHDLLYFSNYYLLYLLLYYLLHNLLHLYHLLYHPWHYHHFLYYPLDFNHPRNLNHFLNNLLNNHFDFLDSVDCLWYFDYFLFKISDKLWDLKNMIDYFFYLHNFCLVDNQRLSQNDFFYYRGFHLLNNWLLNEFFYNDNFLFYEWNPNYLFHLPYHFDIFFNYLFNYSFNFFYFFNNDSHFSYLFYFQDFYLFLVNDYYLLYYLWDFYNTLDNFLNDNNFLYYFLNNLYFGLNLMKCFPCIPIFHNGDYFLNNLFYFNKRLLMDDFLNNFFSIDRHLNNLFDNGLNRDYFLNVDLYFLDFLLKMIDNMFYLTDSFHLNNSFNLHFHLNNLRHFLDDLDHSLNNLLYLDNPLDDARHLDHLLYLLDHNVRLIKVHVLHTRHFLNLLHFDYLLHYLLNHHNLRHLHHLLHHLLHYLLNLPYLLNYSLPTLLRTQIEGHPPHIPSQPTHDTLDDILTHTLLRQHCHQLTNREGDLRVRLTAHNILHPHYLRHILHNLYQSLRVPLHFSLNDLLHCGRQLQQQLRVLSSESPEGGTEGKEELFGDWIPLVLTYPLLSLLYEDAFCRGNHLHSSGCQPCEDILNGPVLLEGIPEHAGGESEVLLEARVVLESVVEEYGCPHLGVQLSLREGGQECLQSALYLIDGGLLRLTQHALEVIAQLPQSVSVRGNTLLLKHSGVDPLEDPLPQMVKQVLMLLQIINQPLELLFKQLCSL